MTILNFNKPRRLTAEFYTKDGKPARVDGSPVWAVSNPELAELVPTASDFSVRVFARAPGTFEVTATADADLGEGVREMVLRASFTVPEPEAASGELVVGEEEDLPPAPEPVVDVVAPEPVAADTVAEEAAPPAPEPDPDTPLEDRPTG